MLNISTRKEMHLPSSRIILDQVEVYRGPYAVQSERSVSYVVRTISKVCSLSALFCLLEPWYTIERIPSDRMCLRKTLLVILPPQGVLYSVLFNLLLPSVYSLVLSAFASCIGRLRLMSGLEYILDFGVTIKDALNVPFA